MSIFGWVSHAVQSVAHTVTTAANDTAHAVTTAATTVGNGVVTAAKATGQGLETAGKATGQGLETAGKTVGKGMATAQNGLTNLMYPDIPGKQRQVKNLETRYNLQRTSLTNQTNAFDANLETYRQMVTYNAALLISTSILKMDDNQFTQYVAQVENNAPVINLDNPPAQYAGSAKDIAFLAGGVLTLRGIRIIGSLAKNAFFTDPLAETGGEAVTDLSDIAASAVDAGIAESTGEIAGEATGEAAGEAIAEVAAEGAAEAGLAETGVGIIAAAGIFAIFSAIQGAQEESKLNHAISKLQGALNQVDGFLGKVESAATKVNAGILNEETRFTQIIADLNAIQKAGFDFKYPNGLSTAPSYTAAMLHAVGQYGFINKARVAWQRMRPRGITWDQFCTILVAQRDPSYITEDEARQFLQLLRTRSQSMQKAL